VRLLLSIIIAPFAILVAAITVVALFACFFVAILLSPITLTVAVITKGTVLEAVLVLLVFLPLMALVFRVLITDTDLDLDWKERVGFLWFGTWMALFITTLFYFVVQAAMMGTSFAVGEVLPLAPTAVAASGIGAFCYECTVNTTKDAVQGFVKGRLANALKKAAKPVIPLD
jgi:hypothetical protein